MYLIAKTRIIHSETGFNFISTVDRHTQYLFIPSVSSNCSVFVKGILTTLQNHGWNDGTHGGRQLGSGDYVAHCCVISHCGRNMAAHGVSQMVVFATFHHTHLSMSHPTQSHHPSHPPPLLSKLMVERDGKKYHQIQPSDIENVNYV